MRAKSLRERNRGGVTEMAPLPVDTTARLFVDYVTGTAFPVEHTLQVRYDGGDRTANAAQTRVAAFLNAIGATVLTTGWRVLRVRTALAGETFTIAQTPIAGLSSFLGSNTTGQIRLQSASEYTWQGHSATGPRRVDISLYGIIEGQSPTNGRWLSGGSSPSWVAASVNALAAASSPLVCIDGTAIVWYAYVNYNRNSYWERRIRLS